MAYRFRVNTVTCINCGICMDLCPPRSLDMTRPSGEGTHASPNQLASPIPGDMGQREWMMLTPVQVGPCIGCNVCAQECPTNAITIDSSEGKVFYAHRGVVTHLPPEHGWQPLNAYTRATPQEPGETPWGENHAWHVAERETAWQSWRTWLGDSKSTLHAPCQEACPVGTNAGLYVSLIAAGRYDDALRVAAEPNPFPSICGRVCTAPCEDACRRGEFDAPIAIRDLKRFATDHATPGKRRVTPPKRRYRQTVAIVGAGPTGLSAAYYLARRGYRVTIFDAMPVAGGMMAIGIPEYRLPRAELNREIDAMRDLGVEFRLNTAIGVDVQLTDLQKQFNAVLLAVGAQRSQRLNIPGEGELGGVVPATTFLKQYNLDPTTRVGGKVVVVGGGSTAMDAARSALRAGASEVHIVYRRTQAEMPAQKEEVRAAIAEGIMLHELLAPVQLIGQGHVNALRCQRMVLSEPDEKGRRRPIPAPVSAGEAEYDVPADTVLIAIGEAPDPSFLPEGTSIEVSTWGGLLVNPTTLATASRGVFAAGDVTYGPKSIIHAAAHGRRAARSIHAYLRHMSPDMVAEFPNDELQTISPLPHDGAVTLDLAPTRREEMAMRSAAARDREVEFAEGLTEEQARREASRCLRCDVAYLCPAVKVVAHPPTRTAPLR